MGNDTTYRWEQRRKSKEKLYKVYAFDILDLTALTLVFLLAFISLRLFFIFEIVQVPCVEMLATVGQSLGYPPVFKMTYVISILALLFWLSVSALRISNFRGSWKLIVWHIIIFICLFFTALFNRSLVPQNYMKAPDGTLVVEYLEPVYNRSGTIWISKGEPSWANYKDGLWYAWGDNACIWLDENKVSYNDGDFSSLHISLKDRLGLGHPHIDLLKERQIYRPLSSMERERFIKKQACHKDITLYGQKGDTCGHPWYYPLPKGTQPPQQIIEYWPID